MRYIERIAKPEILEQKADTWRDAFVGSDKKRPDNSKYAHRQIRDSLNAMSFRKCFYCERKLKDIPEEIDHFIDEIIRAKNDSDQGRSTIQKYKLNSDQLDLVRARAIQQFHKVLIRIQKNMNREGRMMSEREKEILLSFQQKDHSFSLMFAVLLDNH